jgi:hypothetical protein
MVLRRRRRRPEAASLDIGRNVATMSATERTCVLCGDPIEPDQAAMARDDGAVAHSGCVYRDADEAERERWMPADATG